ncbi:MAG TPA: coproporphyrinogen III oxidase family protein, partial [Pseudobdellovibrionaceae bacterium]|nr:coproporphyrinogen III oxidase family protein [Pseudobdellovibrionaceae bacterium]
KMEQYLKMGINRFSVGAQTFNDSILKYVHREHNAQQTRETLTLLKSFDVNYSFDLLFALPGQDLQQLQRDLDEVQLYSPQHVSPYCLTVNDQHPLARQRLDDDTQLAMFDLIHQRLCELGYHRYEISNYAKPSYESRHNLLYWTNQAYWGVGLSAHSYRPRAFSSGKDFGLRFWNPKNIHDYHSLIQDRVHKKSLGPPELMGAEFNESLALHQALTDFCHTSLRLSRGLSQQELAREFSAPIEYAVTQRLSGLQRDGLIVNTQTPMGDTQWSLSDPGVHLSNLVFEKLTFLADELPETPSSLP